MNKLEIAIAIAGGRMSEADVIPFPFGCYPADEYVPLCIPPGLSYAKLMAMADGIPDVDRYTTPEEAAGIRNDIIQVVRELSRRHPKRAFRNRYFALYLSYVMHDEWGMDLALNQMAATR